HRPERLLHSRDARCQASLQALVQRIEHGTVRHRLCADSADGLGRLPHFRPTAPDEVVYPPYSSVDHPDAHLDNAKPLQRHVASLTINEPRAEDADEAQNNEQHRKGNSSKASRLLEDFHTGFLCDRLHTVSQVNELPVKTRQFLRGMLTAPSPVEESPCPPLDRLAVARRAQIHRAVHPSALQFLILTS